MNLEDYIRAIPDFPEKGILFRDITPLLAAPDAFSAVCERFVTNTQDRRAEAIVAIESRGFIFAAPVAVALGLPLIPVRKAGKLPSTTISVQYDLEYGRGQLDIHSDAIAAGQRVLIIDDLIATGGTALAAAQLVEQLGGEVVGFLFVIELAGLNGRSRLASYDIESLVTYD